VPQAAGSLTYVKLIGAMFMWGGTWIAGRIVAQELPAPLGVPAIRFLLAGLVLAGFALATEGRIPRPQTGSEWGIVSGLALTGIFLYALCFFHGLRHITAGRGALVVALTPVVVALAAWSVGRERMNALKLAGVAIAMAGCLTVIGNGNPLALLHGAAGIGEWLILGCVLCWTAYTFIGRRATRTLSPLAATLWASLIGAVLIGTAALLEGDRNIAAWSWRAGFGRAAAPPSPSPGLPRASSASAPPGHRLSSTSSRYSPSCRPPSCSTNASGYPCLAVACWSSSASG